MEIDNVHKSSELNFELMPVGETYMDFFIALIFGPLLLGWIVFFYAIFRGAWMSEEKVNKYLNGGLCLAATVAGPILMVQTQIDNDRPEAILGCALGMVIAYIWSRRQ
jgi:hypothetical protein